MGELKSQKDAVLMHLKKYGSITPMQALENYGCYRLSAVIFELRKKHIITTMMMEHTDQFGNSGQYAKYILKGENNG